MRYKFPSYLCVLAFQLDMKGKPSAQTAGDPLHRDRKGAVQASPKFVVGKTTRQQE